MTASIAISSIANTTTATVTVSANDPNAAEAGSDPGQFTGDLGTVNNTGGPITVSYTIGGSATGGAASGMTCDPCCDISCSPEPRSQPGALQSRVDRGLALPSDDITPVALRVLAAAPS